ncbi:hypothetical protein ANN_25978 [Periplaneta americana]|uniref:Paired domain-containing protein n=1 Tax=Periplaneta americana TaxID=6978 RepID=A0ABQ8S4M8_PERAM|nr:hypothetical protein ANN_25978 [Periplaneta americana]
MVEIGTVPGKTGRLCKFSADSIVGFSSELAIILSTRCAQLRRGWSTGGKMGRKGNNATFDQRQLVIYHHEKGLKYTEIAKILRVSKSSVGDIVRRYENEDRIESIPQKGQPKKLTEREERSILKKIKENPRLSATKLAACVREEFGKQTASLLFNLYGFTNRPGNAFAVSIGKLTSRDICPKARKFVG